MGEEFIAILIIALGMLGFYSMINALRREQKAKNRTGSRPAQEDFPPTEKPEPPQKHPTAFMTFESAYKTEKQGWDSRADFHEGEDPCHDGMMPVAAPNAEMQLQTTKPMFDVKELTKGFVIGEILNRRKR